MGSQLWSLKLLIAPTEGDLPPVSNARSSTRSVSPLDSWIVQVFVLTSRVETLVMALTKLQCPPTASVREEANEQDDQQ